MLLLRVAVGRLRAVAHYIRNASRARASTTPGRTRAPGHEKQDGAVVDDGLYLALVVFDDKLGVLDGAPALGVAVGAAEVEVLVEEGEHVLGEVGRRRW